MRKCLTIWLFISISFIPRSNAQFLERGSRLREAIETCRSDSDRIVNWGKLAEHYYTYSLDSLGDEALKNQLLVADLSNRKI